MSGKVIKTISGSKHVTICLLHITCLKTNQATRLKYKKPRKKLQSNSSRLELDCNPIGPTKLLQSIWLDNSNQCSDIDMISFHFTSIIVIHDFITLISTNNKTIEFMFPGTNMFWARLKPTLARPVRRGLKWALRRAQNIFMPKNINSITIIITLEGIEKINTEKMTTKHSEECFFLLWVNVNKLEMASRVWLAA